MRRDAIPIDHGRQRPITRADIEGVANHGSRAVRHDDEVGSEPLAVVEMEFAARIGAGCRRSRDDFGTFVLRAVAQCLDQFLTHEDVHARRPGQRALLHDATRPIEALVALQPASMRQQLIENAVFLEHLGGIVLDVEAGAAVTNLLRTFVHANGPALAAEHHREGETADAAAGDFGMPIHACTSTGRLDDRTSMRASGERHDARIEALVMEGDEAAQEELTRCMRRRASRSNLQSRSR